MKKQKIDFTFYEGIVKTAVKHIQRSEAKVIKRCLLEGCRYGVGLPTKVFNPQDRCIYCGQPRPEYEEEQLQSLTNLINKRCQK